VFSFELLRVLLADLMLRWGEMSLGCSPRIRIKTRDATWGQELLQLSENGICLRSQDLREDSTALMIAGMPEPALRRFLPNKTPHFIHVGGVNLLDDDMPGVSRCV
jgi:hypothetical protein